MKKLYGILILFFCYGCGPDLKQYEYLKEPAIKTMPSQKMLTATLKGAPEQTAMAGFKAVFKTYFKLKGVPKTKITAKSRWIVSKDTPMSEWIGILGVPVPDSITSIPEQKASDVKVELSNWEYGEVAEILHIGPYDQETAAIEKLHAFIKEKGYVVSGLHEEEYLKGPGMFFKGNPKNYYTIIRYQIKKEEPLKVPAKKK